ncbi:hypothetical protein OG500_29650 [Kitasatospora sp. NBC_01250]|uniref:hypothetical protein n=1 Tax=Kitasatospora sp. NBC_01250 TaxID=2903571 RepID=UPI002E3103C1|nr:hypothetical protein [Kitasatospora sp. NBC_01250]
MEHVDELWDRGRSIRDLLGSAAPPVLELPPVIEQAQAAGWDVSVNLSTTIVDWMSGHIGELEELTGHPVRFRHRRPVGAPPAYPWEAAPGALADATSAAGHS